MPRLKLVPSLGDEEVLALLFEGDVSVAPGSSIYALFRDQLAPTLEAADLIR